MSATAFRRTLSISWRQVLAEHLPPLVVCLLMLPWIIAHGRAWPWHPSMIDFDVYRLAVQDMLAGKDIYTTSTPGWNLKFIYPPIAAIIMAPLALGPATLWRVVWTVALVWAQQTVLRRCGLPRGWQLGFLGAALVLALEPLRTTVGYGQVNTLLMALVVVDLLPDAAGERRLLPRGSLIGLAAAIKLTPLLFLVFAFLAGRRRVAVVGAGSFVLFTGLGAIMMWHETLSFFLGLAQGQTGTATPMYVGNQSLLGLTTRLAGSDGRNVVLPTIAVAGVIALLTTWVAARWWRTAPAAAVALVGLATCLASPLSWTHHHVWILPLLASILLREQVPGWWQALASAWVLWVGGGFVLYVLPHYLDPVHPDLTRVLASGATPLLTIVLALSLVIADPPGGRRARVVA